MAAGASGFFASSDCAQWKRYLVNYQNVLGMFCTKKKKKNLLHLDNWYQTELSGELKKRGDDSCLRKLELTKLMEWKLTRGKFRPRLTEMVKTNPDQMVEDVSSSSFQKIDQPEEAIKEMCKLKAVGPATASAILTAYCPEKYAFMADEAVSSVLSGKIDYTMKYYLTFLDKITKKAKELSKKDTNTWTPHDVELALWTHKISCQLDIKLKEEEGNGKAIKRKSNDADDKAKKKSKTDK